MYMFSLVLDTYSAGGDRGGTIIRPVLSSLSLQHRTVPNYFLLSHSWACELHHLQRKNLVSSYAQRRLSWGFQISSFWEPVSKMIVYGVLKCCLFVDETCIR